MTLVVHTRSTGALRMLALCFLLSGLLRTGSVVAALPETIGAPAVREDVPGAPAEAAVEHTAGAITALAAELRRQRAAIERREVAVEDREQLLQALEQRLHARLAELAAAQRKLEATAALVDDAAHKDVRRLADMYQQMKPKQAGQIFDEMEPSFAAGFLGEMRPEAAALILASMQADKAYAVSVLLAGRNAGRNQIPPPAWGPGRPVQGSSTHSP